jgi:hypothetical protein
MRLVQIGDKFAIVRGIFFKEYMDMTDDWYCHSRNDCYWWPTTHRRYAEAPAKEYALDRLAEYRAARLKHKLENTIKTIKWWV